MKSNALKQTKLYITYETNAYNVDKKRKTVYAKSSRVCIRTWSTRSIFAFNRSKDVIINSEVPNPNQKESDANQGVGNKHRGQFSIASKFQTSLVLQQTL